MALFRTATKTIKHLLPPLLLHPIIFQQQLLHPIIFQQQLLPYSSGRRNHRFFPKNAQPSQNTRRLEIRDRKREPICSVCSKPFVNKAIWRDFRFRLDIIDKYCRCGNDKFVGGLTHDLCPRCDMLKFNVKKGCCLHCAYTMPLPAVAIALKEKKDEEED